MAKWAAIGGLADGGDGAKIGAKVGPGAAILTGVYFTILKFISMIMLLVKRENNL